MKNNKKSVVIKFTDESYSLNLNTALLHSEEWEIESRSRYEYGSLIVDSYTFAAPDLDEILEDVGDLKLINERIGEPTITLDKLKEMLKTDGSI